MNLKYNCEIGTKFPDCGTRTGIHRERCLLFPFGLWLVAVKSSFLASRCLLLLLCCVAWRLLDAYCYIFEASRCLLFFPDGLRSLLLFAGGFWMAPMASGAR